MHKEMQDQLVNYNLWFFLPLRLKYYQFSSMNWMIVENTLLSLDGKSSLVVYGVVIHGLSDDFKSLQENLSSI